MAAMMPDPAAAAAAMVQPRVAPKGVRFGDRPPKGIPATEQIRIFQPEVQGPWNSASREIRLQLAGPGFLNPQDSFVLLTLRMNHLAVASTGFWIRLDTSIHSLFSRLRIEGPSANELERTEQYGALAAFLYDIQMTPSEKQSDKTIEGCRDNQFILEGGPNDAFLGQASTIITEARMAALHQGALLWNYSGLGVATANFTVDYQFCFPVISSVLNSGFYVPMLLMRGQGLVINYTTVSSLQEFTYMSVDPTRTQTIDGIALQPIFSHASAAAADTDRWSVRTFTYWGSVIEFDASFNSSFIASLGQVGWFSFFTEAYEHYTTTTTYSTQTLQLPFRYRSLNAIFLLRRMSTQLNAAEFFCIGDRFFDSRCTSFSAVIGGVLYPQTPHTRSLLPRGVVSDIPNCMSLSTDLGNYWDNGGVTDNRTFVNAIGCLLTAWQELRRCFRSLNGVGRSGMQLTLDNWTWSCSSVLGSSVSATAGRLGAAGHALGLDFTSFGDEYLTDQGINTAVNATPILIQYVTTSVAAQFPGNVQWDCFARFSVEYKYLADGNMAGYK